MSCSVFLAPPVFGSLPLFGSGLDAREGNRNLASNILFCFHSMLTWGSVIHAFSCLIVKSSNQLLGQMPYFFIFFDPDF